MPVDYAKVQKIFLEVLKEPAGQNRVAFIDEACGTDIELRDFIRGMLDVHEKNATPIPQGPTKFDNTKAYSEPALTAGTIIGDRYKIIELIAEGGMGSVYRACRITDMRMEVAIKVIKPGMDSQQVLARFNIEKQALAIMKHDNIARVLDAGMTEKRLPYFVMELVKGLSLTKFCDDSKLNIEQRLELFEQICSAVQHAHQKGIVHRDLKPSNILVALYDDKPVPKVIDFGLAKALYQPLTDDDIRTRFGMFVGTWQYTAPEQAKLNSLDIDTRADIYSLGVILYELLTGTTPLEKQRLVRAAYDEIMRIIQEEEPQKPSTKIHSSDELPSIAALRHTEPVKLEKQIRGELDWIVMKALDKDRNRRYASANEFAADIRRFLVDEPVQAGPPTFRYKASKFLQKHRGKVLVAGLLIATALIGAVVSTIGWVTAARERDRADRNAEISQAVNDFLREDLLSEVDPGVQIRPGQAFISNITVAKALDRAAEKVGTRFKDKPVIEAAIRHTIGKSYLGLGDIQKARQQLELAEQLRSKHTGLNNPDRLSSLYELGWVYLYESKFNLAEPVLKEAAQRRDETLGTAHRDTLKSRYAIALLLEYQDKPADAQRMYEQVLSEQKRTLTLRHRDTLATQRELATLYQGNGRIKEAEALFNEVFMTQIEMFGKTHPDTMTTMNAIALLLEQKKDYIEAEVQIKELLELSVKVLGKDNPSHLAYQINLTTILASQKKYSEAIALSKEIIPKAKQFMGLTAHNTLGAMNNYAAILVQAGKPADAEPILLDAFQGCRQTLGEKHEKTILTLENLIDLYKSLGKQEKVKEYERELAKYKGKT